MKLPGKHLVPLLTLLLAVAVVYGHTLDVPWYLDDMRIIVNNGAVRDLSGALKGLLGLRGVSVLSLALNYAVNGYSVAGYHLVNIALHAVTCLLVYLLLLRLFRFDRWWALFGSLVFAVHPLQTQSVTYTVQRMNILAALFALASLYVMYGSFRRYRDAGRRLSTASLLLYAGAVALWVLALLSKENAAVLPFLMLVVFAYVYRNDEQASLARISLYLAPLFAVMGLAAIKYVLLPMLSGANLAGMADVAPSAVSRGRTPLNYFMTEWTVYLEYLRLAFLPVKQRLFYDYPLTRTFFSARAILSLFANLGLLLVAYRLRRRCPLFLVGVLWFFIALSVESTFIPLDTIFEHRMYLPLFGVILAVLGLVRTYLSALLPRQLLLPAVVVVLLLAGTAWARNNLWRHPLEFSEADARRSPRSEGALINLSKYYIDAGRLDEADTALQQALDVNPSFPYLYNNLATLRIRQGRLAEAEAALARGLLLNRDDKDLLRTRAVLLTLQHRPGEAIAVLTGLLQRQGDDPQLDTLMGANLNRMQRWTEALPYLAKAMQGTQDDPRPRFEYGFALFSLGRYPEAASHFERVVARFPENVDCLYGLGISRMAAGDVDGARQVVGRLAKLAPQTAAELNLALQRQGH